MSCKFLVREDKYCRLFKRYVPDDVFHEICINEKIPGPEKREHCFKYFKSQLRDIPLDYWAEVEA
ncbi:MAG: hypothetical protein ACPLRJ_08060 [Infirmifilum uzonense]|uniref:hypothetical protein n=1 Tax=Infirmifilum uzonense TaxID=1550241 RepID=UPI003C73E1E6